MNATSEFDLTIVIPVYNHEESLPVLFAELERYKAQSSHKICVMLVNDASTDKSLSLIRDYCMRVQGAYFLSLVQHSGVTGCLKAGLDKTFSPYMGYTDPSLRTCPQDFELLYAQCHDAGLVCAQRDFSGRSRLSHLPARFLNFCRRLITHDGLYDAGCPLKIAETALLKKMPWFSGMHYLMPALVNLSGSRVVTVTVKARRPITLVRHVSYFKTAFSGICDLMVFLWMRCRYVEPAVREGNLD